jgi:hypothetical protein
MSKNLPGPFVAQRLGERTWLLTTGSAGGPEVVLQVAVPAFPLVDKAVVDSVVVNWRDDLVEVTLNAASGNRALQAESVIVHEPQGRLYESLPLAGFDAGAQRFWRRVFLLIRIPGGRRLLGFVARRKRGRSKP